MYMSNVRQGLYEAPRSRGSGGVFLLEIFLGPLLTSFCCLQNILMATQRLPPIPNETLSGFLLMGSESS